MKLNTILEDFGYIVHVDTDLDLTFAWNGFATINVFSPKASGEYANVDTTVDYDLRTVDQAADAAFDYCRMVHKEMLEAA